jgi:iron complex outermembrane receptor protein
VLVLDNYQTTALMGALPLDRVGIANSQGTIPQWRAVGSVAWKHGDLGVSTTTTFVPSYQDSDWWTGPLDRRIGSQVLVDVQTWLDLRAEGFMDFVDGSTLTLGARNVFDDRPEFANAGGSEGYDISQNDLIGRFIYFRISKRF